MNPLKLLAGTAGVAVLTVAGAIFVPNEDVTDFQCPQGYARTVGDVNEISFVVCEQPGVYTVTAREVTEEQLKDLASQVNGPTLRGGYLITIYNEKTFKFEESLPAEFVK